MIYRYRKPSSVHPESPLRIPMVRRALEDRRFRVQVRAVSKEWRYRKVIPVSMTGFNPHLSTVFVGGVSRVHDWLKSPGQSARAFNRRDNLFDEALYIGHDYLHAWTYWAIDELMPKLGLGAATITAKNLEDFVFCHLVSEAVAVVGLDYWYLATLDINEVVPIGTTRKIENTAYHESNLPEFRRFNPRFAVQTPAFFRKLVELYCTGYFVGFDIDDMNRSPQLYQWLDHEVGYSELQREYIRLWLNHLAPRPTGLDRERLRAPVRIDAPWKRTVVREIGNLLWAMVKEDKDSTKSGGPGRSRAWRSPKDRAVDLRFLNLNGLDEERTARAILAGPNVEQNFEFFFHQLISRYDYSKFDPELVKLFPALIRQRDYALIARVFRDEKRVASQGAEPMDLMLLN